MIVLAMGLPGSGKAAMAKRLEGIGFSIVATGKLIRDEVYKDTELGKKLKEFAESANYVDDDTITRLVRENFNPNKDTIFEGFPRNKKQAEILEDLLSESNKKLDLVLHFDFTEEEMYKRLKGRQTCKKCQAAYHEENFPSSDGKHCDECGTELIHRIDDEPEKLKLKLEQYRQNIKPLIEMYREKGIVETIDARQDKINMYYDVMRSHKNFLVRHV